MARLNLDLSSIQSQAKPLWEIPWCPMQIAPTRHIWFAIQSSLAIGHSLCKLPFSGYVLPTFAPCNTSKLVNVARSYDALCTWTLSSVSSNVAVREYTALRLYIKWSRPLWLTRMISGKTWLGEKYWSCTPGKNPIDNEYCHTSPSRPSPRRTWSINKQSGSTKGGQWWRVEHTIKGNRERVEGTGKSA